MNGDRERVVALFIAQRIRQLRYEKGWTQKHLAAAAHVDQSTISRIESGRRLENLHSLAMVALALGIALHDVLPPIPDDRP